MDCRHNTLLGCDELDCECEYEADEKDNRDCPYYDPDWKHPYHCSTCKLNYGSDRCMKCEPGTPSNYVNRGKQTKLLQSN